jgi:hypothetical protein
MITIYFDGFDKQTERAQKILSGVEGGAAKAIAAALSRALPAAKNAAESGIERVYNVKRTDYRGHSTITTRIETQGNMPVGYIKFHGTQLPLYRFSVSPTVPTYSKERGSVLTSQGWKRVFKSMPVSAKIRRDGAMQKSGSAFIALMESGHIGVFDRVGNAIQERMGLSAEQMVDNKEIRDDVLKTAEDVFDKRIDHEILRILNGWGA